MNKEIIRQLIEEIETLLDAPTSDFQDEGERRETILDLVEAILLEVKG